ncbi:MAG: response regulator [Armatimonadetes bacterium]|nr:response regulator [Armatimonadota bacterium]
MSDRIRALVVDDEPPLRRMLRAALDGESFEVLEAATVREGIRAVACDRPDVVLLDLGLPDGDGLSDVAEVRSWCDVPIIALSARQGERDKVLALDAGADDYVTKPFSIAELAARMRAAVRSHRLRGAVQAPVVRTGGLSVDLAARQVHVDGVAVRLTKQEFNLLAALARHVGKVLTHRQLLTEVWGPSSADETHYLRVCFAQIRRKIEQDPSRPRYVVTDAGVGYMLRLEG